MRCLARIACLTVLALLSIPHARADLGGYVIEDFHVDLTVETGSDLLVRERIEVHFSEPRHGIYREIPVRYTDPRGYGYSLGFRLLGVEDDTGRAQETKVTSEGRYVKIRIGSASRQVGGRVVYVLRYRVRDALGHFAEHDELYWNATGHEWGTLIRRASATVRFPDPGPGDRVGLFGYAGRYGSRDREATISRPDATSAVFEVTHPLESLEGLTVVAAWPPGLVRFPGAAARALRFLTDNWVLLAPVLALGFLLRRYWRQGRDPEGQGSIVVRYEPPQGISPGEIGTLVDEKADLRDITATVVDLAVRGYLRIEIEEQSQLLGLVKSQETMFQRLKPGDGLLDHERIVFDGIFAAGERVGMDDLKERFYKNLPGIHGALYERMTSRGYFAGKPSSVRRNWRLLGLAAGVITVGAGLLWVNLRGGAFPHAAIAPVTAGVLTAALFFLFAPAMPRRTRKGVAMRGWALGFEEFVDRVERDKLDADRARNVFESLLPYAMALGVATAWARQFEDIYKQAGPAWFAGAHNPAVPFSTRNFERSLSTAMAATGTAMQSSPRSEGSSGSGGGGFSGGGGGGGGGGSW